MAEYGGIISHELQYYAEKMGRNPKDRWIDRVGRMALSSGYDG